MVGTLIRRPLPPVSDFIRTLLDDANATAALATLGVSASTYLPVLTAVANVDATTTFQAEYIRVGNIVSVSGRCTVDPTTAGIGTTFRISLPVASNFTAGTECAGVFSIAQSSGGGIAADAATDTATVFFVSGVSTNAAGGFSFMYTVI